MTEFRDTDASDAHKILTSTLALVGVHDVDDVNVVFLANLNQQEVSRLVRRVAEQDRLLAKYKSKVHQMAQDYWQDSARISEFEVGLQQACDTIDTALTYHGSAESKKLRSLAIGAIHVSNGDPSSGAISPVEPRTLLSPGPQSASCLMRAIAEFVAANPFDDDSDPALDTPTQRVVRAFQRWEALSGVDVDTGGVDSTP